MTGKKPTKVHDMRTLQARKNYGNTANRNVVHGMPKPVKRQDITQDVNSEGKKEGEQDG